MNKKLIISLPISAIFGVILYLVRSGALGIAPFPLYYCCFFLVAALCFALSYLYVKEEAANENSVAESGKASLAAKTTSVISAVLLIVSDVLFLTSVTSKNLLTFVIAVFVIFCAVSFIIRAKYSDRYDKSRIFSLFPVYFNCIFLLVFYRANASKLPAVSSYAPEILLLITLIVTAYFSSALLFGKCDLKMRTAVTILFLSLTVSELLTAFLSPSLLPNVSSGAFICMITGFALFYISSILSPCPINK